MGAASFTETLVNDPEDREVEEASLSPEDFMLRPNDEIYWAGLLCIVQHATSHQVEALAFSGARIVFEPRSDQYYQGKKT